METDDDDATIRERFSLVQSILFIDFTDILPAQFQEKMVESCGETMQFGLVSLITDSGGQGGRTWQAVGGGKNGHETFRQARI